MRTLQDAGTYILGLSKREADSDHWQTAMEALIMAAEDYGPVMHARIGMLRALNHGKPAPHIPRRKRVKAFKIVR